MLGIIITALIAWSIISYIDKKRGGVIESFTIVAFLAIPSIIILIATFVGAATGLSAVWLLPAQLLFFFVPFLMCKFQLDYRLGVSAVYGGIVFGTNVFVSILFMVLFGA